MTLADEDTKSILNDNANRAFQGNVTMQMTQPGGQLWNQAIQVMTPDEKWENAYSNKIQMLHEIQSFRPRRKYKGFCHYAFSRVWKIIADHVGLQDKILKHFRSQSVLNVKCWKLVGNCFEQKQYYAKHSFFLSPTTSSLWQGSRMRLEFC